MPLTPGFLPEKLIATPGACALAELPPEPPIRVVMASLALGGAERIVSDWLGAEAALGRECELALLYDATPETPIAGGVRIIRRAPGEALGAFYIRLGARWVGSGAPAQAHLLREEALRALEEQGLSLIPVLHNDKAGWGEGAPRLGCASRWPLLIGCAPAVARQAREAGYAGHGIWLRHIPQAPELASDPQSRKEWRRRLRVGEQTLLLGMSGSIKAQKNYPFAMRALAKLAQSQDACLCILGGTHQNGSEELRKLLAHASELGVGHLIRLPGFQPSPGPLLSAFDAFLSTSFYEGFPMAVVEALQARIPCLSFAHEGFEGFAHPLLRLLPLGSNEEVFAREIQGLPRREAQGPPALPSMKRIWSVASHARAPEAGAGRELLFATANLNAGGAQRSLVNLLCELHERGHGVGALVCSKSSNPHFGEALNRAGVPVVRMNGRPDAFSAAEALLARAARSRAQAIVFWNMDPKVKMIIAKFARPELRIIDVSPGGYAFEELSSVNPFALGLGMSEREYWGRIDALVHKFHETAPLPAGLDPSKVWVIPNGVARLPMAAAPRAPLFAVSGRIAPSKRLEQIIGAFELTRARHPGALMRIYGQAEPREREYAQALWERLPEGCELMGDSIDLSHLRGPFSAQVVLGTHQGCPNAALEALSAGIPVIGNDSGGTREAVIDGRTGILLPEACDSEQLSQAMGRACEPEWRARLQAGCVGWARENFGMPKMAEGYLKLFRSLGLARMDEKSPRN